MLKKKRFFIVLFIFLCSFLVAEKIQKVAVLNLERVVAEYPKQSRARQVYDQIKKKYENMINNKNDEIEKLKASILSARKDGDLQEITNLQNQIAAKNMELNKLKIERNTVITRQKERLKTDIFSSDLRNAANRVATSKGYTLVLYSDDPKICWKSPDIDITDDVIAFLRKNTVNSVE